MVVVVVVACVITGKAGDAKENLDIGFSVLFAALALLVNIELVVEKSLEVL